MSLYLGFDSSTQGLKAIIIDPARGEVQQHGSVYLNGKFPRIIAALNPALNLASQFAPALSRKSSPIWMDSSTGRECAELTEAVGSRMRLVTGSLPHNPSKLSQHS